jgi:putative addiction module component (TIGR02574 family)
MTDRASQLLAEVLELSQAERAEIATTLLTSLHDGERSLDADAVDAAWTAEIRRRVDRVLAGEPGIPWEKVRAEGQARLRARRPE